MYHYKIRYIVVIEDENGELVETVSDEYYQTEAEAQEFINDMLAEEED